MYLYNMGWRNIHVKDEVHRKLKELAEKKGCSICDIIQMALEAYEREHGKIKQETGGAGEKIIITVRGKKYILE